ncbi:hypothetical protein [Hyphomicrobium sp. CS1GBMeth3]|uniref:hypothetical protein n=1 Tax=Hyphomicrobium sp. CS1GBMeth3 TaxID=1892845 RepID=UPI000931FECB|nr:hypothetical protein [Hyphomicrobium sp. CS1GBMeth3]
MRTIEPQNNTSRTFGSTGHLSARIANLLEIIETILECGEPGRRRDEAALGLVRAVKEDADELADLLN